MKSGNKIHAMLLASEDRPAAVSALGNGDLRSLMRHAATVHAAPGSSCEEIIMHAVCEAAARWLRKGKGKGL